MNEVSGVKYEGTIRCVSELSGVKYEGTVRCQV